MLGGSSLALIFHVPYDIIIMLPSLWGTHLHFVQSNEHQPHQEQTFLVGFLEWFLLLRSPCKSL